MVVDPRTWMEVLSDQECWELVADASVGRIGLLATDEPEIYPVNFAVDSRTIVFRTASGSKLHAMLSNAKVCFEVDGLEPVSNTGWSVLVKGHAECPTDTGRLERLGLRPWAQGFKPIWMRIRPTAVR